MAAQYVLNKDSNSLDVLHALVFIFQVLGAVDLSLFARERILLFVFEGEDGQLSEEDLALKVFILYYINIHMFYLHLLTCVCI